MLIQNIEGSILTFYLLLYIRLGKPVTKWYIINSLFFFNFRFQVNKPGGLYVYAEVMKTGVASFDTSIPSVTFSSAQKKHRVFSVEDIEYEVGLLERHYCATEAIRQQQSKPETFVKSKQLYVFKKGDPFPKSLADTRGSFDVL
jgi:hypothetical protein